jgi:hypothetical protein
MFAARKMQYKCATREILRLCLGALDLVEACSFNNLSQLILEHASYALALPKVECAPLLFQWLDTEF